MSQSEIKTMPEAVEYWILVRGSDGKEITRDLDRLCLDYEPELEPDEKFIKAISYAAYSALKAECERLKEELEERQVCPACGEEFDYKDKIRMSHDIRIYEAKITELAEQVAKLSAESRLHDTIVTQLQRGHKAYTDKIESENSDFREALDSLINQIETVKCTGPNQKEVLKKLYDISDAVLSKHENKPEAK